MTELSESTLPARLIKALVDDVCMSFPLPPRLVNHLSSYVIERLIAEYIMDSESSVDASDYVYAQEEANTYSLVALGNPETPYHVVLFPHITALLSHIWEDYLKIFKTDFPEYKSYQLGETIKLLNNFYHTLKTIIGIQVRSNRRSGNHQERSWDEPDMETLERYYKCERKTKFDTYEAGAEKRTYDQGTYLCDYCNKYHNGRELTNQVIPLEVQQGRWVSVWRRNHMART